MKRKLILSGVTATAGMLVLASAAFACTYVAGTMQAKGDKGGVVTAVGSSDGIMTYCAAEASGHTNISKPLGTVNVKIFPYAGNPLDTQPGCQAPSQLPDTGTLTGPPSGNPTIGKGTPQEYTVTWTEKLSALTDCMNRLVVDPAVHQAMYVDPATGKVYSSSITITNGTGSGNYYINSGLYGSPVNGVLCVSDEAGGRGMQLDFTFV